MSRTLRALLIALLASLATAASAGAFAQREFPTGDGSAPGAIVGGPRGSAWFLVYGGIDRIDAKGAIRRFPVPHTPGGLTVDRRGNAWFSDPTANTVDRLMPNGRRTDFPAMLPPGPFGPDEPTRLTIGKDGNVWFVGSTTASVSRLTPSGQVTRYALHEGQFLPQVNSIVGGPDGRIWIAHPGGDIDAVTTAGKVTSYPLPRYVSVALAASGPDRRMWLTTNTGKLLRLTMAGSTATTSFDASFVAAMVSGPGRRMWTTRPARNAITDVTANDRETSHGPGSSATAPLMGYGTDGLAVADSGHLWVSEPEQDRVALVTTGPACAVPALVGQTQAAARLALHKAGCRLPSAHGRSRPSDRVISQSVSVGSVVSPRTLVSIGLGRVRPACRLPLDATVIARDSDAVVARRKLAGDSPTEVIVGCATRVGRIVTLTSTHGGPEYGIDGVGVGHLTFAGTYVAYALTELDNHYNEGTTSIRTADLATDHDAQAILTTSDTSTVISALAVAPSGAVAWIGAAAPVQAPQSVYLWSAGTTTTLDTGPMFSMTALSADATSLHWTNAGVAKSAPI